MSSENTMTPRLPDPAKLIVSSSPHLRNGDSVRKIMLLVILALSPSCAMGVYYFGFDALRVLFFCVAFCVGVEWVAGRLFGRPDAWKDGSAAVTGVLLAMVLSSLVPWWACLIGAILAIFIAKQVFGGLGYNPFNPALVARIGLMIGFTKMMTTWVPTRIMAATDSPFINETAKPVLANHPVTFFNSVVDGVTCATPLGVEAGKGALSFTDLTAWPRLWDYAIGNIGGCLGETSAIALLLGGLFLIYMKVIKWHIPLSYIGAVAVFSGVVHLCYGNPLVPSVLFNLLTGGLFIGAFFMATDMVTSPMTPKGQWLFGIGCGVITCVIREWGAYPEGVMFSIVLMNALTPLIDRFTANIPFGYRKPVKEAKAK